MIKLIRLFFLNILLLLICSWGFYAHKTINKHAVFALPSEMNSFFIHHINDLEEGGVRADKRRYIDSKEACKHYIDLDLYGLSPFDSLPLLWYDAKQKYSEDTLHNRGLLPWVIYWEYHKLIAAMDSGCVEDIIKYASDLGHYVSDACVPLHTTSNYNGQFTNQDGIHALWESKIPELVNEYDFYIGKAVYLDQPLSFSWGLIKESYALVDSTLSLEKKLSEDYLEDNKYRPFSKNFEMTQQYSSEFILDYNDLLNGMVERRLRKAVFATASFWYSAWVDAGQPDLSKLKYENKVDKINEKQLLIPKRNHE